MGFTWFYLVLLGNIGVNRITLGVNRVSLERTGFLMSANEGLRGRWTGRLPADFGFCDEVSLVWPTHRRLLMKLNGFRYIRADVSGFASDLWCDEIAIDKKRR